ncbi:hypothetical protein BGZ46_002556 [Entomortierella lignicola]|nr:hypothetical protein BGZ46_002556 [Entomortierella lignicola]
MEMVCRFDGCERSFTQLGNLKTHERKHTGERPFKCGHPGCDKAFTQLGNLKTHEHIHDVVKPFMCRLVGCGKTFSQLGNLKTHTAKMHPDVFISDEELALKTATNTSPILHAQASCSGRTAHHQEQTHGQVITHFHPYQRRPIGPQWSEKPRLLIEIRAMIQYQDQHAQEATYESEVTDDMEDDNANMHRRHQHGVTTTIPWPGRDGRHAGILDFGLNGGASFDPDKQSWTFARDMQEFIYCRTSPLTQILPRTRPWEPKLISEWPQETRKMILGSGTNTMINNNIRFIESALVDDRLSDVPLLYEIITESGYEDYKLSFYDPFIGNLCAVGRFVDLPIVVTPDGRTGADLSISLVLHKPQLKPPFNFLAPKSTLISFTSAINQIATPSFGSPAADMEVLELTVLMIVLSITEQILVRTREFITIIAPTKNVPSAISRVYHNYLRVLARIPSKPSAGTDQTIHAAVSPYSSNSYALIGDKGSIALWSRSLTSSYDTPIEMDNDDDGDDMGVDNMNTTVQGTSILNSESSSYTIIRGEDKSHNIDDPWRGCVWGAHPSQLFVASRKSLDLIDARGVSTQTCLFTPRTGETIQAIQEDSWQRLTPFQTYIATSHQIACIDQRYAKRPIISWAHGMNREMPCGIKTMDMTSEGSSYSTVLTWSKRNADITAYNISSGSDEREPKPMTMKGRAQELPSFQAHVQYTNSSSLRDPMKRYQFSAGPDQILQQAIKPPLLGLAILPDSMINESELDYDNSERDASMLKDTNISKFSLIQYAYTGAVYAQEYEIRTKEDIESEENNSEKDSILTADYNGLVGIDTAPENALASSIAHDMIANEHLEEDDLIDSLIEAAEGHVAPWKRGVKEAQEQADDVIVNMIEFRYHDDFDLRSLLDQLQKYMTIDREAETNKGLVDIEAKVEQAMDFINNNMHQLTLYEILQAIDCINLPSRERDTIAEMIQQNIEMEPFATAESGVITCRKLRRIWTGIGLKVDTFIQAKQPSVDSLISHLETLYPLPKSVILTPNQAHVSENTITNQLANLTIPERDQQENPDMDEDLASEGDVWPTLETRLIRKRTIRRLAQDLLLSSTAVIKASEPETSSAQSTSDFETFQYLFQSPSTSNAPKVKLSSKPKSILDEWTVGEDPRNYVYTVPETAMNDAAVSDEEDQEEKREHEERMIQLRLRREKREEKIKSIRRNDPGYNVSAGGSLSQPAGVITDPKSYDDVYGDPDEDGTFSLPTVISASQPTSVLRTNSQSRSQSQLKPKPKPTVTQKNPILSASQPLKFSPISSVLAERKKAVESAHNLDQNRHVSFSQSQSQNQSQSQSQDGQILWSASQPVPGAFATRKIPGVKPTKPKKKKNRAQGF